MNRLIRSLATAGLIAAAVELFSIYFLSINLPRVAGPPDEQMTHSITLPPTSKLKIVNENGNVVVRAVRASETTIQVDVKAYDMGEADLPAIKVYMASLFNVEALPDGYCVTTEPAKRPDGIELRADYTVLTPEGTAITVAECNGNVWISRGCGEISVTGRNSDVEIVGPRGPVTVDSVNGRIRLTDAPQRATVRTVNGNIYAHMTGGALDAATTNGAIVARLLNRKVSACTLNSENGGITLVLPADFSATIDASAHVGRVRNEFDNIISPDSKGGRRLHGVIGSGDTTVHIETLNGNIWVARGE